MGGIILSSGYDSHRNQHNLFPTPEGGDQSPMRFVRHSDLPAVPGADAGGNEVPRMRDAERRHALQSEPSEGRGRECSRHRIWGCRGFRSRSYRLVCPLRRCRLRHVCRRDGNAGVGSEEGNQAGADHGDRNGVGCDRWTIDSGAYHARSNGSSCADGYSQRDRACCACDCDIRCGGPDSVFVERRDAVQLFLRLLTSLHAVCYYILAFSVRTGEEDGWHMSRRCCGLNQCANTEVYLMNLSSLWERGIFVLGASDSEKRCVEDRQRAGGCQVAHEGDGLYR